MKAECIAFEAPEQAVFKSVKSEAYEGSQLITETIVTGVSTGTETRVFRGKQRGSVFPLIPGYENVGRVVEAPSQGSVTVGDIVFVRSHNYSSSGMHKQWGAQISRSVTTEESVIKVPGGVDPADAIYAKVGGISLHGVRRAGVGNGDWVAVVGLGIIGHLVVQHAVARGARVIALDVDTVRLDLAKKAGALHALDASDDTTASAVKELTGGGVRVAFDATGRVDTLADAIRLIAPRAWDSDVSACGKLVIQGSPEDAMVFDYHEVFAPEIDIITPRDCDAADMSETLSLIASNRIRPSLIPTERLSPKEPQAAYRKLLERSAMRVLFDWTMTE